jgi:hypothetical protein
MKLANANKVRAKVLEAIMTYLVEAGEDCEQIASNSFNFPIVEDGEEGWVEIVVKIPKEDEGYEKREEYEMKVKEKEEKKKAQAEAKAKKIERDKKLREQKKKEKESV